MTGVAGRRIHRLPPRPQLPHWLAGGASAGLLLGLAELLVAWADGVSLTPPLALALLAADAGLTAIGCVALALVLRGLRVRCSHSQMVGAVLGPLAAVSLGGPAWRWLRADAAPTLEEAVALGAGALAVVLAALGAAQLADRAERSGTPASGTLVWSAFASLLVLAARLAGDATLYAPPGALAMGVAALAAALLVTAAWDGARRRGSRAPRPFGQQLALLALLATLSSFAPWAAPWLLVGEALPAVDTGPPNILFAVFPAERSGRAARVSRPGVASAPPTIAQLRVGGLRYDVPAVGAEAQVPALLRLDAGDSLVARLHAAGFATAAIHAAPAFSAEVGAAEVDARPGAIRALRDEADWIAAAPLLLGPAQPALALLGLDAETRSPEELAAEAGRWLLHWRTRRAPAPFFLLLDFRGASGDLEQADAAFARVLEQLGQLEVEPHTALVLSLGHDAQPVIVRPPAAAPPPETNAPLADALLALTHRKQSGGRS